MNLLDYDVYIICFCIAILIYDPYYKFIRNNMKKELVEEYSNYNRIKSWQLFVAILLYLIIRLDFHNQSIPL